MLNPDKKFLTISEAAKYLGISMMTLRRWHDSGTFQATFVSPGKHRYYSLADLERKTKGIYRLTEEWVESKRPYAPKSDFYCETSDVFKARLEKMAFLIDGNPALHDIASLVSSAAGEIGNNSFDHNLGNWPDISGIFFAYDIGKRIIVLADRGQGILTTLRRVLPNLSNDMDAVHTAFTEHITGRAPEHRGNGLKYAMKAIMNAKASLSFQSGNALLKLPGQKSDFTITRALVTIPGCFACIKF